MGLRPRPYNQKNPKTSFLFLAPLTTLWHAAKIWLRRKYHYRTNNTTSSWHSTHSHRGRWQLSSPSLFATIQTMSGWRPPMTALSFAIRCPQWPAFLFRGLPGMSISADGMSRSSVLRVHLMIRIVCHRVMRWCMTTMRQQVRIGGGRWRNNSNHMTHTVFYKNKPKKKQKNFYSSIINLGHVHPYAKFTYP